MELPEQTLHKLTQPKTYVLEREHNIGYTSMETNSTIISGIVNVFPVFFVLVAALVCSTVMTRMVEDERTSLGTLLSDASNIWTNFPHLMLYPALVISLLMICFNLFGNGLRDAFNPALRGVED